MRTGPALLVTVLAGVLLSAQSRVNADLSDHLHRGGAAVPAATISFAAGTVGLFFYALATRALRPATTALHRERRPWWLFSGGLGGASLVCASAASVPVVGVALTSVFVVTGQTAGSLGADGLGLGPSGRHHLTAPRLAGAALAIVALIVGTVGHRHGATLRPLLLAAVVLAGVAVATQQAINGRLAAATGSAPVTALISFAVGTAGLLLLTAILTAAGKVHALHGGGPAWLYLGGLCGAVYITLSALAIPTLGVLRLSLGSVAGQLLGGLVLDLVARHGAPVHTSTYAAVVLTLAALGVASLRATRPKQSPPVPPVPPAPSSVAHP